MTLTRRYVFWRSPTGQPHKKEDGKHAPAALLTRIGESATVNSDGSISWPFPQYKQDEFIVLSSAVVLGPDGEELNQHDSASIVLDGIKSAIRSQGGRAAMLSADVLREADKKAAAFFRRSMKDFILITTLSVMELPAKQIRIRGCEISQLKRRGTKYPIPEALGRKQPDDPIRAHLRNTKYATVKVKTQARSQHAAVSQATDALDFLRGSWTLLATHGSWSMRLGSTHQTPIGAVETGPVHTLHHSDGSLASDVFWFEPGYSGDRDLFQPKRGWSKIEEDRRWAMKQIRHRAYAQELERLFMRYANALDYSDFDVALLQMWSLLESVTDTVGSNYDETIKRAIWIFADRKLAKETLEHLRTRRNQYVHSARSNDERDQAVHMIKSFVEPHLIRLVKNDFEVNSIQEYGAFLALPSDPDTLKKQKQRYSRAIKVRSK